jgi:hypothetical protein
MDCFVSYLATPRKEDGAAGRLHISPFSLSALLNCTVFFPMTTQGFHFATI